MPLTHAADRPFSRIGIAGVGLIGGSIAAAARRRWPGLPILAADRASALSGRPGDRGLIDDAVSAVADLGACDLVVLAAPIDDIIALLEKPAARPAALVTDVGSTKRRIAASAGEAGVARFVGGHPIAGAAQRGSGQARADLFDGRPWPLVRGSAPADDGRRLERFCAGLGGVPAGPTPRRTIA